MDKIIIEGGQPLIGDIVVSGSKNAALPLMTASLLTEETLSLSNLPQLADITTLANLLEGLGVTLHMNGDAQENGALYGRTLDLCGGGVNDTCAPYDLVRKMRASVLVLGPLLARFGHAEVSLPGGCAIGTRPVDLHLSGLEALGAQIDLEEGYIKARAPKGLKGAEIVLPIISVGATENLLMAASLAEGQTRLIGAASEPEVVDLADCLVKMGAKIAGIGTSELTITGVSRLSGAAHRVIPDRIEAGTFLMAAGLTDGDLNLRGARADHLKSVITLLESAGLKIEATNEGLRARRANGPLQGVDVMTEAYPGFPTDLQAQFMALMATAEGASMVSETIFENRFMHVPELMRMGANITVHGGTALVRGRSRLKGAPVMATDLRASVSLVIAALGAEGQSEVNRVYHLDRGYERVEQKLAACGARIRRVPAE
ncbi:UDP-N-acetylglucosamine 1-carboxyvinyltransferase [Limibacillus halophilus]|uniref:UDP-N-acetylglucosamine 1-carboxyvinyltransferase n=1 Tax=Limibacillus halophilus TaxID=1579333 RepID=A0A839SYZ1_9PROT|nr:UDP-N-acetylglucosamine 1-carboxyvinyltransferase [Limibacillus halophilus]MBB3066890.1 UDP-N-acetylglucosamine 1-carboxyvinyltransferase [Limibacillus halophilus]